MEIKATFIIALLPTVAFGEPVQIGTVHNIGVRAQVVTVANGNTALTDCQVSEVNGVTEIVC